MLAYNFERYTWNVNEDVQSRVPCKKEISAFNVLLKNIRNANK
jgi:hypothetical protein